jgi:hypothetical protein
MFRVYVPDPDIETSEADRAVELIASIRGDVEAMIARRGWVLAQAVRGRRCYQVTRKNGSVLFEASTFRDLRAWLSKQPAPEARTPRAVEPVRASW